MCTITTVVLGMLIIAADAAAGRTVPFEPQPEVQEAIATFANTRQSDEAYYRSVLALRELATPRRFGRDTVLEQTILFAAKQKVRLPPNDLLSNLRRWVFRQDSDESIKTAMLRHFESTDPDIRRVVRNFVLRSTSTHRSDDPLDPLNQHLVMLISKDKADPDWELVHMFYERAPETAVDQLFRSTREGEVPPTETESRQMSWALHVIADTNWKLEHRFDEPQDIRSALAELDRLSRSDKWYVRMYVAEMLRRHETYREKPLLERLRADPNEHIAKRVDLPYYQGMPPEEFEAWKKDIPLMPDRPR